jgi:ABC-type transport system substrate-binding protein
MKLFSSPFFSFLKQHPLPHIGDITSIHNRRFSVYTLCLYLSVLMTLSIFLSLLMRVSDHFSVVVPDYGGTLAIGVVGAPRYINPLLATSDTDRALSSLVFSGLVRRDDSGSLTPVLADHFIASPEGTAYRFTLREKATFSDGTPITSTDVVYTYETKKRLSDSGEWRDVTAEAVDSHTVIIRTSNTAQSLVPLLSLGIVSHDSWSVVDPATILDSTLNTHPVASGPYTSSHAI